MCDARRFRCSKVFVTASNFYKSDTLTCKIQSAYWVSLRSMLHDVLCTSQVAFIIVWCLFIFRVRLYANPVSYWWFLEPCSRAVINVISNIHAWCADWQTGNDHAAHSCLSHQRVVGFCGIHYNRVCRLSSLTVWTADAHKWNLVCCMSAWFDWFMHRSIVSIPSTRTPLRYCRIWNWNVHCHRWLRTLRLVQPSIRGTSVCLTMDNVTVIVCRWPSTTPTVWTASVANSVSRRFDILVSLWL